MAPDPNQPKHNNHNPHETVSTGSTKLAHVAWPWQHTWRCKGGPNALAIVTDQQTIFPKGNVIYRVHWEWDKTGEYDSWYEIEEFFQQFEVVPGTKPQSALEAVLAERKRQDELWGTQNHDPFTWLTILMEEVGETSKEAMEHKFRYGTLKLLREEAVQTAAVALAFVECLDRGEWDWGWSSNDEKRGKNDTK